MIRIYLRDQAGQFHTDPAPQAVRRALEEGTGLLWADLEGAGHEEARALLQDVFRFHPLTVDDCLNGRVDPPKLDDYGDYLFLVLQTVRQDRSPLRLRAEEVDLYLGTNYVVTFHAHPLPAMDQARTAWEQGAPLCRQGADRLAHDIIDRLVDEFLPAVETIDEEVAQLEEAILDQSAGSELLESVLLLRRETLRLRRAVMPQRDLMNRVSRGEFSRLIRPELWMYYRDVYDHLVRVEDMISSLRDVTDGALNIYLSAVSNRLNEIMKVLSIVATVILPLTLVTGIYGMNFQYMPELDWRFGYPAALLLMAAMAVVLLGYFRRRGWL